GESALDQISLDDWDDAPLESAVRAGEAAGEPADGPAIDLTASEQVEVNG
ncbi:MAG: hypothetical protein JOZ99_06410, partial [Actinobacteria bacterium]|nr:hypothetical protein [Actinomycetota bacterium]